MTRPTLEHTGLAPAYRDDPRLAPLIHPGGPFEVENVVLAGIPLRDFVRAPRTIVDVFRAGAAHDALVNVVYEGERLTFADVRGRARGVARELRTTFGVRSGDRVGIAMRNLPEFVIGFWGAALAGAVVVPLNSWWTGGELTYALRDAGVSVLFADGDRCERIRSADRPEGLALVGVRTDAGDLAFDELTAAAPLADDEFARLDRDDPVTLLYTSGTTGRPKGALNTNRGTIANLWNMAFASAREAIIAGRRPAPPRQSVTISTAPLFHIGGVSAIVGGPLGGGKMVLMRRWDAQEWARLAVDEEVTALGGVPAVARQILEYPGVGELGLDVRLFSIGGAAVPPDLVTLATQVFGADVALLNGYGLTETTSAVVTNVGVEFAAHPDSVGRPNLTADVKVVDADGTPLGLGDVGEICFRSPQVARGYWNDAAATKTSFRDGWFHSGDLGCVDAEGFVHVVDRLKDVVIRGGENVYCAEVEAVLHEHPDVVEAAVVGIDDRALGERVCAVVVPRPGTEPTLASLRAFAAGRLAAFKCPEALVVLAELPTTATGKIAKTALRAQVAAAAERAW
ncbi:MULTISPECIES: class I adenylate-forming enzyme family protein [unclassified Pseudofrankia]|uniref:class I adenylate-forming enzyme family protein n=1 Tax=unclassified Pseudofrankia TaxID=2994372 RepID=UPI0009F57254|nr:MULTISPECIES: class I adenylate-forming enzyme family protein [unclassified Pseudofrankia]MDT3440672.1 class I adenylate-forming enzyme family protein [Pseudofrankia sp. BMG5.37]